MSSDLLPVCHLCNYIYLPFILFSAQTKWPVAFFCCHKPTLEFVFIPLLPEKNDDLWEPHFFLSSSICIEVFALFIHSSLSDSTHLWFTRLKHNFFLSFIKFILSLLVNETTIIFNTLLTRVKCREMSPDVCWLRKGGLRENIGSGRRSLTNAVTKVKSHVGFVYENIQYNHDTVTTLSDGWIKLIFSRSFHINIFQCITADSQTLDSIDRMSSSFMFAEQTHTYKLIHSSYCLHFEMLNSLLCCCYTQRNMAECFKQLARAMKWYL